jgi:hypothetical protein
MLACLHRVVLLALAAYVLDSRACVLAVCHGTFDSFFFFGR